MKDDETRLKEILRLPPGSHEEMTRALDRVMDRLRSNAESKLQDPALNSTSPRGYRARTALFTAAAFFLTLILAGIVWNSTVFGVLDTPDGESRWIYNETAFGGQGGTLTLRDKSRVEIRPMSDLSLQQAVDGVRIRLTRGSVIVNATEQGQGHLYVQTKDVIVSVAGTVFFVNAEKTGSRVAVFQGEVQVQQGATETQLRPGDQVATNPAMDVLPVREEISWSRHVEQHLALLDQARTAAISTPQAPDEPEWPKAAGGKLSFESATVGPSDSRDPGYFPLSIDNIYRSTGGVFKASFPLRYYIEFAYKLSLTPAQREAWLSQVPRWIETDHFYIYAKSPTNNPTKDQMRLMLQSLLAERFKLALHFEPKQTPVLALTLVKPGRLGPQIRQHAEGPPCPAKRAESDLFPKDTDPNVWPYSCDTVVLIRPGVAVERLLPAKKASANSQLMAGRNITMEVMMDSFLRSGTSTEHPLVDQTGLSGSFDFSLEWTPEESPFLEAVKEQLGMKLEVTRALVPVLIIDHVEKP